MGDDREIADLARLGAHGVSIPGKRWAAQREPALAGSGIDPYLYRRQLLTFRSGFHRFLSQRKVHHVESRRSAAVYQWPGAADEERRGPPKSRGRSPAHEPGPAVFQGPHDREV